MFSDARDPNEPIPTPLVPLPGVPLTTTTTTPPSTTTTKQPHTCARDPNGRVERGSPAFTVEPVKDVTGQYLTGLICTFTFEASP